MADTISYRSILALFLLAAGCRETGQAHLARARIEPRPFDAYIRLETKESWVYGMSLRVFDNDHVEMITGAGQDPEIHFREARNNRDANVRSGEYFVATDTALQYTHILQHAGIDRQRNELWLWDIAQATVDRIPYDPATGTLTHTIGQVPRHITIDSLTNALAIDQDGNGIKNGALSPLVWIDGHTTTPQDLRP